MWNTRMENKRIKIKQGVNWGTVIGTILFITILTIIFSIRFWIPDNRPMKIGDMNERLKLDRTSIQVSDYCLDQEKKVGEIWLKVYSQTLDREMKYGVTYDGTYQYADSSYEVIEGSVLPSEKENEYMQEVIIQFDLPEDWYYINVTMELPEYKQVAFPIDYRTDHLGTVEIKGDEYLKAMDEINVEIVKTQKVIEELKQQINGYDKTIQTQERKIADLEVNIKAVLDEKAKKEKQAIIDTEKKALEENKTKKKESEDRLNETEQALQDLERTKNEKR